MDATSDSELPAIRHERRVTVPIPFTADIAMYAHKRATKAA